MDNKNYIHIPDLSSVTDNFNINTKIPPISFVITTPLNSTISSLDHNRSNKIYSDNLVITQPIVSKLLSETIKQEEIENNSLQEIYSKTNRSKTKNIQLPPPTVVTTVHLNPRETLNGLSIIPMTNTNSHLMSTLNPAHLSDGAGSYFVSGLTDLASNYKMNPSSNTDMPSPSSSSNSSNPPSSSHHHQHHQTRRHGEGGDPTRKREMRLQKNREAARECRRKKKEYIKCLEERVAGLEAQNKALIEELRQLKELYCQREETSNKSNSKTTTATR
ncbi:unnamed protein product [Adineta steineri]|uniref:BZIP domain-containing protein n=1 Tax=Adineta steineri TaxID=433720 RepID=A0A814H8C5_9BILA|nr:unnamed protein product [Adineta steineri]CAF3725762.1 unnamed protein product [Adineta steineri]